MLIAMFMRFKISFVLFQSSFNIYRTSYITFTSFGVINLINSCHYYLLFAASALVLFFKAVFAFNFSRSSAALSDIRCNSVSCFILSFSSCIFLFSASLFCSISLRLLLSSNCLVAISEFIFYYSSACFPISIGSGIPFIS